MNVGDIVELVLDSGRVVQANYRGTTEQGDVYVIDGRNWVIERKPQQETT